MSSLVLLDLVILNVMTFPEVEGEHVVVLKGAKVNLEFFVTIYTVKTWLRNQHNSRIPCTEFIFDHIISMFFTISMFKFVDFFAYTLLAPFLH